MAQDLKQNSDMAVSPVDRSIANRQYKDRLFKMIFGSEEHKEWALSLYNAVNESSYSDPSDLKITTIGEYIYLDMHNDVSYLIDDALALFEHQSSPNPNMPLRGLLYFAGLYERYIEENNLNIYSSKLIHLPIPKFIVFYNGTENAKEKYELKLSDAFAEDKRQDGCIEIRATVYNVNKGFNTELMNRCYVLSEYADFVSNVRLRQSSVSLTDAVHFAIHDMPEGCELKEYLVLHEVEVTEVFMTEYNAKKHEDAIRKEALQEGIQEGEAAGFLRALVSLARDGAISITEASKRAGMTESSFEALCDSGVR